MGGSGGHALIIEDEILVALEVEALLTEQGYSSFDVADTPQSALACAISRPPDLITADFRIVGGTGLEAVEAIEAKLGKIPTVFVTGNGSQITDASRSIVDKPISPARLAEACLAAVRRADSSLA